jgi:hypothetical protein
MQILLPAHGRMLMLLCTFVSKQSIVSSALLCPQRHQAPYKALKIEKCTYYPANVIPRQRTDVEVIVHIFIKSDLSVFTFNK